MKLLLLLFFAFTTPLVLFLATIIYGNTSSTALKTSLDNSGIYTQLSNQLAQKDMEAVAQDEQFTAFVSKRFTPAYIKDKAESAIDDSIDWINGKSKTAPSVTFKELKDDMMMQNPDLLTAMQRLPTEAEFQEQGMDMQQREEITKQAEQINSFIKKDFTVQLGQYLQGFKDIYHVLQIALPILTVILFVTLLVIGKLADDWPSKFNWIGAALMTSGIVGFGVIFFNKFIASALTHLNSLDQSGYVALITPILLAVTKHYMEVYLNYQGTVSVFMLLVAAGCFLGAALTRKQASVPQLTKLKPSTFWQKPQKKNSNTCSKT